MSESLAIPFIVYDQKEGFKLTKDAENYLSSLSNERKVGVISIVGKYRTGKSFFVNRVLLNKEKEEKGFKVGPTVNPCTKGLWLWKKELVSSEDDNMDILVIDTEGFGGMDENVNHDSRIFLFSLLLSSFFIYNSQGSIDENALNSLSLIINLAKDIQIQSNGAEKGQEDPANYFPSFLWVIRDFALRLVDQFGNNISQKEYLEKALELQKGVSDQIESKNRIRKLMKHFFKERDCATLVIPTTVDQELRNLDELPNENLRPEFIEQITSLRKKIFKKVKPKTLCGKTLNGQMMVEICKAYINAINKGNLPNIENAWTYVKRNESQKAYDSSVKRLEEFLKQLENEAIDPSKMESLKDKIRDEMKKILRRNSLGDEGELQEYFQMMEVSLEEKFNDFKKNNKLRLKQKYAALCEDKVLEMEAKLRNEEYANFLEFQGDLARLREQFEKVVPKRDATAEKYFVEVSERLHKLAAEKVSRRQEREHYKQFKQAENLIVMAENELKKKKDEFENEIKRQNERLSLQERELNTLRAHEQMNSHKHEALILENEKLVKQFENVKLSYKEDCVKLEKDATKRVRELEIIIEQNKTEGIKRQASFDKQLALLEQEGLFNQRENKGLLEKINILENENRQLRAENTSNLSQIDRLKFHVDQQTEKGNRERDQVRNEFDKKVMEITSETERKRDIIKQHSELTIEKSYLENQVNFYKQQLEENKKVHETLLIALQQGKNKEESEYSNNQLLETRRNKSITSNAIEQLEATCKTQANKIQKLKKYKFAFKSSSAFQCSLCSKFVPSNVFLSHLSSCQQTSSNQSNTIPMNCHSSSTANSTSSFVNIDFSQLNIAINQTMVRETSDNKPYTEYLILLSYGSSQWEVARKYKAFCELHQQLMQTFPGMKFPDSSNSIINSSIDINTVSLNKRPTVIEDRRKALQQYIKDLSKIDLVRNSKPFKLFLDLENNTDIKPFGHSKHNTLHSINQENTQKGFIDEQLIANQLIGSHSQAQYQSFCQNQSNVKDKNSMPQSPSSFLKQWNEKNLNKENNPRNPSISTEALKNIRGLSGQFQNQVQMIGNQYNQKPSKSELNKKWTSGQFDMQESQYN